MIVLIEILQLCNVFTQKNFLIEEFPLINCLKIFINAFVNQARLNSPSRFWLKSISTFNTENCILRIAEENSETNKKDI